MKPNYLPASIVLKNALDTMRTNAPINDREGNKAQAKLERSNARSYKEAIQMLKDTPFKKK